MRGIAAWMALALALTLGVTGCDTGQAVIIASPVPPDAGFRTYAHPSGVFTIRLPPDWSINDLSTGDTVFVEFSPPGSIRPPVSVYVINTGVALGTEAFSRVMDGYMALFHDPATYTEVNRQWQRDGSWRIDGIRHDGDRIAQLNTFLQRDGSFFSVIEVELSPDDPEMMETLNTIINTYRVDPTVSLGTSEMGQVPASEGEVGFGGLYTWVDGSGGFRITGMAVNQSDRPLEFVRIAAYIFDGRGRRLVEAEDFTLSDVILPGEHSPFSIRFPEGRPTGAVRYELHASARYAEFAAADFYDSSNFEVNAEATFNADGYLVISGTVTNIGPETVGFVKVIVAVLDDMGHVVATDATFASEQQLEPGRSSRFEVIFYELGGPAVNFSVSAQARVER